MCGAGLRPDTAPVIASLRPHDEKAVRLIGKAVATAVALVLLYQLWIFAHVLWWIDHNPVRLLS